MHCPFCQHDDTRVIDSRVSDDGASIRRRRECAACGERFNTFETAEIKLPNVVKNDGRLTACTVQDESPNDLGVGQAALSMASQFQVDLLGPDGKSRAGSYIQVPVRIRIR